MKPALQHGASRIHRFGTFELDTGRRRLTNNGAAVTLSGKPMSFLLMLLERPGELIPKEEIIQHLWGDITVTDNALVQLAGAVRKVLKTDSGGNHLDRHAHGGYRLVTPVTTLDATAPRDDPDDLLAPHLAFMQGRFAFESLDVASLETARDAFSRALVRSPDHGLAHLGMANVLLMMDQAQRTDDARDTTLRERSEAHARQACVLLPSSADAWITLALVRHQQGQTLEAIAAARKATLIEPSDWRLDLRMAWVSWGEDRLRAATRVMAANAQVAWAYWFAATVLIARGHLSQALEYLDKGAAAQDLQLQTGYGASRRFAAAGLHWLRGLVLAARGETDAAIAALARETLFEDRGHIYAREASANSWYALGVLHRLAGRPDESRAAFEQALARVPRHPMTLLYVDPASLSLAPGGLAGVVENVDHAMVAAAWLCMSDRRDDGQRVLGEALNRAPYGSAGWLLPVEPTLAVSAGPDAWEPTLAILRARAL